MELDDRMKRRGFTAESFYQTYRDMCSQPMRFLGSIESGDVWFSRHFDPILACISPTTLLVMYYPRFWSRDITVAYLNEAFHWLEGRRSNSPYPNGGIKFAARKNEDGIITLHEYVPGDWAGYVNNLPLATCTRGRPRTDESTRVENEILHEWLEHMTDAG